MDATDLMFKNNLMFNLLFNNAYIAEEDYHHQTRLNVVVGFLLFILLLF